MIVYRCISEREIADMIGIPNHINSPHGQNTFKYKKELNINISFIIMTQQFHLWTLRIIIDIMINIL